MLYSCDDDFSYSPLLVFTSLYPRCCLAMAFFLAVVVVRYDTKHRCKFVISVAAAAFSYSSSTVLQMSLPTLTSLLSLCSSYQVLTEEGCRHGGYWLTCNLVASCSSKGCFSVRADVVLVFWPRLRRTLRPKLCTQRIILGTPTKIYGMFLNYGIMESLGNLSP